MTTTNNTDRKVPAYFITTLIIICFAILPFADTIYADMTYVPVDAPVITTVDAPALYNMSHAKVTTFNVDAFTVDNNMTFLAAHLVETDLGEQELAELFYTMEEINVRIDGQRVSILSGDNGQF